MGDEPDDENQDGPLARLEEETEYARAKMEAASEALDDSLQLFGILLDDLREKKLPGEKEFTDGLRMITKARLNVFEEKKKYAKCVLTNEGLVGDAPLDLDAIRSEIGSRLDRLRDAG